LPKKVTGINPTKLARIVIRISMKRRISTGHVECTSLNTGVRCGGAVASEVKIKLGASSQNMSPKMTI
jgi:hypothetical protein